MTADLVSHYQEILLLARDLVERMPEASGETLLKEFMKETKGHFNPASVAWALALETHFK